MNLTATYSDLDRKKLHLVYWVLIIAFCAVLYFLSGDNLELLSFNLFFLFLISGVYIIRLPKSFVWVKFYYISIFVFLGLHPILHFFGILDINNSLLQAASLKKSISKEGIIASYKSLNAFLIGTFLGVLLIRSKVRKILFVPRLNLIKKTFSRIKAPHLNPLKYAFWFLFWVMVFDEMSLYVEASKIGYVNAFHVGGQKNPFFVMADILYPLVFCFLLKLAVFDKTKVDASKFRDLAIIFLIPYFITFLAGFRGEFIAKFSVLVMIYLFKIRGISTLRIIFLSFAVVIGVVSMEFIRFSSGLNPFDIPIELYFEGFLYAGNTFSVLGYVSDYSESLYHGPLFLFGPIIGLFSTADTYSVSGIETKPYLAQHLMYIMDSKKFFGGSTIGSSSVAELFLINDSFIFIFFCAMVFIFIAQFFAKNFLRSGILLYISFTFFENFFMSPRGGFLKFIDKEFALSLIFYIVTAIIYSVLKTSSGKMTSPQKTGPI